MSGIWPFAANIFILLISAGGVAWTRRSWVRRWRLQRKRIHDEFVPLSDNEVCVLSASISGLLMGLPMAAVMGAVVGPQIWEALVAAVDAWSPETSAVIVGVAWLVAWTLAAVIGGVIISKRRSRSSGGPLRF